MPVNQDYKDLFKILNEERVEYLVVGAHAVIYYAEPRYTKDLDIWINPSDDNSIRVYNALRKFGAPLIDITPETFTDQDLVYQIGIAPNRFDILMSITSVSFSEAWNNKTLSTYDGIPINIIGKTELIKNKQATARLQDLLDLENLMEKND